MRRVPCVGVGTSACTRGWPSSRVTQTAFTVYEVNGWRLRRTGSAVSVDNRAPDAALVRQPAGVARGPARRRRRRAHYTHRSGCRFVSVRGYVSCLARAELEHVRCARAACGPRVACRSTCARRSARTTSARRSSRGRRAARARRLNLFGVVGALAGVEEGIELNVLGLTFGVDPLDLSLKAADGGEARLAARGFGSRCAR